jgi:hypothetical protein
VALPFTVGLYDPITPENSRQTLTIRHPTGPEHLGEHVRRSTSAARRACAVGTTIALIGLTTGLGIMTATSASAVEADRPAAQATSVATGSDSSGDTTTPTDAPANDTAAGSGSAGSEAPGDTAGGTGTPAPGDTAGGSGTPAAGDAGTGTGTGPGSDAPSGTDAGTPAPSDAGTPGTAPATAPATTPTAPDQPAKSIRAAARQSVTIEGDLTVGSELVAKQAGFTSGSKISYLWTDESGATLSETATYTVAKELAGTTITVTLEGDTPGETATATTDTAIAPVFVDEDGQPLSDDDADPYIEATAGEAFSYTFRAFSTPAPTLSITWFDDEGNETKTAPAGVTFDPATGVVSGTLTKANEFAEFTVTATTTAVAGTVSSDQYGQLSVEAGAPAGIEVTSLDKGALLDGTAKSAWLIYPNGDVYTEDLLGDSEPVKGGTVSVPHGGTLLVAGAKVDRFGNEVFPDFDEETGEPIFFTPTVTSDVATDVIEPDSDLGEIGVVSVTFPHASTHTLTVSGASLPSTVFAVDVRPAAVPAAVPAQPVAPAAVVTHHVGSGRLAYTGTDSTDALPWALGLVLAGLGLIGARTVRRRRAQR